MKKIAPLLCLIQLMLRGADAPARPKITGIAHIAFYVSDLAKARAFWIDFLGYQECFNLKRPDSDEVRIAFIKINETQYIELFADKPRGDMMLNHISFLTDNADQMRDYLAAKGVKVPDKVGKGQIGNKNYNVTDPDGNIVEIVQYEPDGWTMRDKGKFLPDTRISNHIPHIGVLIGPLSAAENFYHGILGFEEIWRGGGGTDTPLSWVNLKVPDGKDYLEFMLHGPKPEPERFGTRNHLALEVPDCEKAAAILKMRRGFIDF
jgi:catechol 2,3-dioxygenase-like lactoylglutathione lyase family enzyme